MTTRTNTRTARRVGTKGKAGIRSRRAKYNKTFRGGDNRANRQA